MKKVLALLLASVMTLSLVACGGGNSGQSTEAPQSTATPASTAAPEGSQEASSVEPGAYDPASAGDITLTFNWWTNQKRTEVTTAACDYITSLYPNIKFELVPGSWGDYWTQMSVQASSNDLPDIMQQDYAYIAEFVKNGYLLDLTPYIENGMVKVDTIPENTLVTGMVDGGNYALCAGVNAPATLYNKTLTDELGITVPDNITWDQFVAISKEIYEKKGVKTLYSFSNSENQQLFYTRSLGYKDFFSNETGVTCTVDELAVFYQRILDGIAEGWMLDYDAIQANGTEIDTHPMFAQDLPEYSVWNAMQWSNQLAALQKAASTKDIKVGITTWPADDVTKANFLKSSQFFSVTRDAQDKDLACFVLNLLINDVEVNKLLMAERGMPAPTDVAAATMDVVAKEDPTYPLVVEFLNKCTANSSPIFEPNPAWSGDLRNGAIQDTHNAVLKTKPTMTAQEAAQAVVDQAKKLADENK